MQLVLAPGSSPRWPPHQPARAGRAARRGHRLRPTCPRRCHATRAPRDVGVVGWAEPVVARPLQRPRPRDGSVDHEVCTPATLARPCAPTSVPKADRPACPSEPPHNSWPRSELVPSPHPPTCAQHRPWFEPAPRGCWHRVSRGRGVACRGASASPHIARATRPDDQLRAAPGSQGGEWPWRPRCEPLLPSVCGHGRRSPRARRGHPRPRCWTRRWPPCWSPPRGPARPNTGKLVGVKEQLPARLTRTGRGLGGSMVGGADGSAKDG